MIIATAGHVDHGKTSLIRALTGENTDRLPEEKKRGLTIDLGFAYLVTDTSQRLAFIDVPGHEKFVRNMIAGVGMVDIAILVVAADDGPMPQTLEHIAILQLMSVRQVVPVISKVDLVTHDRVKHVINAVLELVEQAGFSKTTPFGLSTIDQTATAALQKALVHLAAAQQPRPQRGYFRMAIDRSFTLAGSGTVVTGTVVGGSISKNDTVTLVANCTEHGKSARVRKLHAQNTEAQDATTGQRCALNLTGELSKLSLQRGDWLVTNPHNHSSRTIDVVITPALFVNTNEPDVAGSKPLKTSLAHWTSAHLHLGTAAISCRIALLESSVLDQNQSGLARLICDKDVAAIHGDRFVLRDQSARRTIAGGRVLDPSPPKRGRSRPGRLLELKAMDEVKPADVVSNLLDLHTNGIRIQPLSQKMNLTPAEVDDVVTELALCVFKVDSQQWIIRKIQSDQLQRCIVTILNQFHDENPQALGANSLELEKRCLPSVARGVVEYHLQLLIVDSKAVRDASVYRLPEHEVSLSASDQKLWAITESNLVSASLIPQRVGELAEILECTVEETIEFLNRCVAHGKLFRVTDNRYYLPQTLRTLAQIAIQLSDKNTLTVAGFRDESGVGRNLVVELLEYFDRCRFTQRIGNQRRTLCAIEDKF